MTQHSILVILAVLAAVGVAAVIGHARRAARRAAWWASDAAHTTGGVLRCLLIAAVLTGIEWATATHVHDWRLLVVLAVPALLAGWTLTRRHRGWVVMSGKGRRR